MLWLFENVISSTLSPPLSLLRQSLNLQFSSSTLEEHISQPQPLPLHPPPFHPLRVKWNASASPPKLPSILLRCRTGRSPQAHHWTDAKFSNTNTTPHPPPTSNPPTPQPPTPPPNSPNPPLHHSGLSVSFHKASNYGPGVRSPGLHCVTNWVNPAGLANRSAIPEAQYCRRAFICPETFQRAGNSLISWQKLPTWGFSPCFSAETGAELPCT